MKTAARDLLAPRPRRRKVRRGRSVNRRIVRAPKILDEGGAAPVGPAVERDPLKALEHFDQQIATDKIDGDILSKFIEFLFQYLTETAPKPVVTAARRQQARPLSFLSFGGRRLCGAIAQALARELGEAAHPCR